MPAVDLPYSFRQMYDEKGLKLGSPHYLDSLDSVARTIAVIWDETVKEVRIQDVGGYDCLQLVYNCMIPGSNAPFTRDYVVFGPGGELKYPELLKLAERVEFHAAGRS